MKPPLRLGAGLCAIAASLLGIYNAFALLSATPLLPGPLAPYSVMLLTSGSGRGALPGLSTALAYLLDAYAGLGPLEAYRALALTSFGLLLAFMPISAYVLTRSLASSAVAALLGSLLPLVYQPLFMGDYSLLMAAALAQLVLTGTLGALLGRGRGFMLLGIFSTLLLALERPGAAYLLAPYFAAWAALAYRRKEGNRLEYSLSLLMGALGVSAFFYPLRLDGAIPSLREVLFASKAGSDGLLASLVLLFCIAGLLSLYYSRSPAFLPLAALAAASLSLFIYAPSWLFVSLPSLLVAGSSSVPKLRGLAALVREGEELVVELRLERLLLAALLTLLVFASLFRLPAEVDAARLSSFPSSEQLSVLNDASSRLPSLLPSGAKVLAPSSLAAWLGALSGLNVIVPSNESEAWAIDAATSTAFRIQTPYIMVDEWQPFSSRRSPYIYHYDGSEFALLLHLDDGTNWMKVVESNRTWPEDMHGMKLISYRWSEGQGSISLTLELWKKGFNVTKQIIVAKQEPRLTISYLVRPGAGVQLLEMALPVYIEGEQKISLSAEGTSLALSFSSASLRISYAGASTPPRLAHALQDYVVANFTAQGGIINASVGITLLNAKSAPVSPRYASFFDASKALNFGYLLTYAAPPDLYYLSDAIRAQVHALDIIDAFNRVLLNYMGKNYVEAPSYAQVLEESAQANNHTVLYKTAGLLILKRVESNASSVLLTYQIAPWKQNATLLSFTFNAWIAYDRAVLSSSCSLQLRGCELQLDTGKVRVVAGQGNLMVASEGRDLQFGQRRVQLQFSLRPQADVVSISISFPGTTLEARYLPTTRPMMQGSDVLQLWPEAGLFQPLYRDELFHLYRVALP